MGLSTPHGYTRPTPVLAGGARVASAAWLHIVAVIALLRRVRP